MDNAIEAIKEFFFDIIGFLVPGIIVLIIGKVVFNLSINIQESNMLINIVVGYILGYLIFALSQIKESWLKRIAKWTWIPKILISYSEDQILYDLSQGDTFKLASEIIRIKTAEGNFHLNDYKSFRNVAMSGSPEADKKVYTFMFRAELFNQLHSISVIVLFFLLLNHFVSLFSQLDNLSIKNIHLGWFFLFLIAALVLRKGWKRFYKIAMSIPFSLYIVKNKRQQNE